MNELHDNKAAAARAGLRLGSRASPLALAQARMTADALATAGSAGAAIVPMSTTGDRVQDRALREIGGKALWTRELDRALLDGEIDAAVHSMKDVETQLAPGLALAAMLPRADVRDRLIGALSLADIADGAIVGTASPRRTAQLLHSRPDLRVAILRGNVAGRLQKVADGAVAATFLAAAGLDRLGVDAGVALDLADWLPAVAQGAVGITCRADDAAMLTLLAGIDHWPTRLAVAAERGLLEGLGGSCHTAVAAHAMGDAGGWTLRADLYSPDGADRLRDSLATPVLATLAEARALGLALAERLLARATPAIRQSLEAASHPPSLEAASHPSPEAARPLPEDGG